MYSRMGTGVTHWLVEHEEIYFRPFCPHKRSRDRDSLPLHVQKSAGSQPLPRVSNIKGGYAPHRPIGHGRDKMGVHL